MLHRLKDGLYYYFAEKNWGVRREYGPYKESHQEEHVKTPWKHWWLLVRLNFHYRILRRNSWVLSEIYGKYSKIPYMDGSESSLSNRRNPIFLAKELMQFDVISFDIFDTLILRPFNRPTDLFAIIGHRLNKIGFSEIRKEAEKCARKRAISEKGNREVTIEDIYRIIEERTGIPCEKGIEVELSTEIDYCFTNPYTKRLYRLLQDQGKTIVLTSDMYLPKQMMEKLLSKTGYTGYDNIYVSCDYGCSKSNGALYSYLKHDYPKKKIVHIGDNPESDQRQATVNGISVRSYTSCHDIGSKFRAEGMSHLVGSAYSGLINAYLHNSEKVYSPYFEYGFIYGGLFVLGFCNWIHSRALAEKVDKILFLSRDGVIFQKVFNMLFDDISNEYFLWSRIANVKYTLSQNKDEFLKRVVRDRAVRSEEAFTAANLLDSVSLSKLKALLSKHNISDEEMLTPDSVSKFEEFFIEEWDKVKAAYSLEEEHIKEYIVQKVSGCRSVAIVDVGWIGSGPLGLKYLIEEKYGLNCKVYCYVGGATGRTEQYFPDYLMEGIVEPYLFSNMLNRSDYLTHKDTNRGVNSVLFEFFTQAEMPSYAGMDQEGGYCFDIPEIENYAVTKEIHEGIKVFATLYHETFQHDRWMLNISGHDAYCPFSFIIQDLSFIQKFFSDVSIARGVGGEQKNQRIVSADVILTKVGAWK